MADMAVKASRMDSDPASTQPAAETRACQPRIARMEDSVRTLLRGLGENVDREGLIDTPKRVAKALMDITSGYAEDASSLIGSALFHEDIVGSANASVVLVRDIDFASTSEATLLPFHGRAHIAYVPVAGVVLGLSKLARITRCYAKRLQSPQRLCAEIAQALDAHVPCSGVAVVLQLRHLCPGVSSPPMMVAAGLAGLFKAEGSAELQELEALLGLDDLASCAGTSRVRLPSAASSASMRDTECTSGGSQRNSVVAPCTPDVSEKASTDGEESDVAMEGAESPEAMEQAIQALLAELGDDVRRSALRGTARRYVSSLLASTSGYQAKLPGSDARAAATAVVSVEAVKSKLLPIAADSEARLPYCDSCVEAMDAESSQARRVACAERCCSSSTCCHSTSHSVSVLTQAGRPHAVLQASVPFHSQCEHHMLPFYGHVHVALIAPEGDSAFNTAAAAAATCESIEAVVAMYTRRLQVQERITQQVADAVAQLHGVPDGDESTARGGVLVVVDAAHMCMVARGVENHAGATTSVASRGCFRSGQELRQSVLRQARLAAMRVER